MKVRGSVRLRADAQQIWDFVSEPENDNKWVDATPVVDVLGNGKSMEVTFRQKILGTETWGTARVLEWREPERLVWDVEDGLRSSRVVYEVKDGTFSQTNLTKLKEKRWLEPFLYPAVHVQMRKQLRALRGCF